MSEANKKQIGGEHYKTGGPEHWDIVVEMKMPYLLGCASKYMSRHRTKNGVQDLEKSKHYLEKAVETRLDWAMQRQHAILLQTWASNVRGMQMVDYFIIERMLSDDIENAIKMIDVVLADMPPVDQLSNRGAAHEEKELAEEFGLIFVDGKFSGYVPGREPPANTTNNPRLGETTEQVLRRVRRVPRFPRDKTEDWDMRPRTPEDGGQHASLYPWFVDNAFRDKFITMRGGNESAFSLFERFWARRSLNNHRLAPLVSCNSPDILTSGLPRELHGFYDIDNESRVWVLAMSRVPPDARDNFPFLQRELNTKEFEELEKEYAFMYRSNGGLKYIINARFNAWVAN